MALSRKIEAIQRSTRTTIPWMVPAHDKLRMKYGWYYRWSMLKYSSLIHFIALIVFTAGLATGTLAYYGSRPAPTLAAAVSCYWVGGTGTWDAASAAHWSSSTGGSGSTCDGGANVPGADDTVIFDSNSGTAATVTLGAAYSPTVVGITLNKSDLIVNLNTNTLTISAASSTTFTFTAGQINNGTLTISGGTSNIADFNGGTFGANVSVTSGSIRIDATTFNGTTNSFTKTGTGADTCGGNNTFGGSSTTTFYYNATSTNDWILAGTTGNNYNGDIKVENTGGDLFIGDNGVTSSISTLADSKTIAVGANGFSAGNIYFFGFTQTGATAQTLTLTSTASILFYGNTTFNGNLTVSSPNIYLNGATFNGTTNSFTKTGTTANSSTGGNTFGASSTTTFYYNATSVSAWVLAGTTGNTYNGDIKVESSGGYLYIAGNEITDPVSTLADGKTITVGANGFSAGRLYFYAFTQTGATAQALTFTDTTLILFYGGTTFNGGLTVSCPDIYFRGGNFNGTTNSFTKTGTGGASGNGGATFAVSTTTTFTNNTTGTWYFSDNVEGDTFTGNVSFVNNSTGAIHIARVNTNDFGGNVTLTPGSGTITVGAGGGTAQFSASSGTQTLTSGGVTIPILTHTGAGTLQLASALTATTLTNSAGTLDLNGQNLSLTAAAAVSNSGTIKLFGSETLTNVNNLDIDSGTVIYTGNNTTNTYQIKDFGATDYFNLSFTDANTNKITLQVADTKTLTVAGALTLSSGSGTFDNSTYDEAINVTSDVTMDNGTTSMGDATWTVSGSFDNKDVTTFNSNLSTLVMNGSTKTLTPKTNVALYNLTIASGASITHQTNNFGVDNVTTVNGTLSIDSGRNINAAEDTIIGSAGRITGAGSYTIYRSAGISSFASGGVVDVATLYFAGIASSYSIAPGTYSSAEVIIKGSPSATSLAWIPSAGTYTFTGNVTYISDSTAYTTTITNSTNNPNFIFKGNVTFQQTAGTLIWTKGAGTITFTAASGTQTVNFLDKTVEDLIIGDGSTTNTVQLTDGVTTDGITVNSGPTLDMNSQAVSYAAAAGSTNDGTIKLVGNETIGANISNLDTDSGWVNYTGTGAYATLPYTGIYYNLNFSGSGSYTLPASLDTNGEFALNGSAVTAPATNLTVGGNFSKTSGTFTHNSGKVTLDGASQTLSGNTTFYDLTKNVTSADTLTFTAASTQTIDNTLDLQGVQGSSLSLRSSNDNNAWNIVHSGTASTYTTKFLSVADSNHTGGSDFVALSSTGGTGNTGWVFPSYYTIVSSASSALPGSAISATLTMKDTNGATVAATGDYTFTFSGASTSANGYIPTATDKNGSAIQFGNATVITLTNGIGTTNITPYKTETASITASDTNTLTTTTPLSLAVTSPTAGISITDSSTKSYFTSPAISVTLTLANTSGTSGATYKLAEDSALLSYGNAEQPVGHALACSGQAEACSTKSAVGHALACSADKLKLVLRDLELKLGLQNLFTPTPAYASSSVASQPLTTNPFSTGYTLTSSDGYHTVYGSITDAYGNSTSIVSSPTITLDATAPSAVSGLQALNSSDDLSSEKVYATTLMFTPSSDATSGAKGYVITKDNSTLEAKDISLNGTTVTLTDPLTVQTTKDSGGKQYSYYIDITNKENTKYTYSIRAMDNAGNLGATLAIDETGKITRPSISTLTKISDLKVEFKQQSESGASKSKDTPTLVAIVTFETDAPATGSVSYGTNRDSLSSIAKGTDKEAGAFNTSHTFTIDGLTPQTTYFFAANATDQNSRSATALASQTSPSIEESKSLFEIIWDRISGFFTTIWQSIRHFFREGFSMGSPTRALAAESASIKELHAVKTYDKNNKYIGNTLYWPEIASSYNLKRDGVSLAAPTTNRYLDLTAQEAVQYRYAANQSQGGIVDAIPGGNPNITELQVKSIAITQTSASVEISWLTAGVASSSKVRYGVVSGSYTQEQTKESLDEAHKVIVNGLDPAKTYFFQASSTSNSQQTATSKEASYNVPQSEKVKSIIVVIYEALMRAFGALTKWINTK